MVRAKFVVQNVEVREDGTGVVNMLPVYDGSAENKQFFKYTPGGSINLQILNTEATQAFAEGKEYYVDFTLASEEGD